TLTTPSSLGGVPAIQRRSIAAELAARLGLTGLAGRASGEAFDLRCDLPCRPYARLPVKFATKVMSLRGSRFASTSWRNPVVSSNTSSPSCPELGYSRAQVHVL